MLKECQENIPNTIIPPSPAWAIQGRMDLCFHVVYAKFWPYHLNVTAEIETPDQATFFQSSVVQFWWACVNCSLVFPLLSCQEWDFVVFCCFSPSASRFNVLCVQRCYCEILWPARSCLITWSLIHFANGSNVNAIISHLSEKQKQVGGVRYKQKHADVRFSFSQVNLLALNTKGSLHLSHMWHTCRDHTHTHTHTNARTHARMHTHTHTPHNIRC